MVTGEIRATKMGERVTVSPGHGGPGLFLFGTFLTGLGWTEARQSIHPPPLPNALPRSNSSTPLKPGVLQFAGLLVLEPR